MRLSEYLLDRIFSLICMLVSALLLFGLLWLIETPATFILFAMNELSKAATPYDLDVLSNVSTDGDSNISEYLATHDVAMRDYAENMEQISIYEADMTYSELFEGQNVELWPIDEEVSNSKVAIISVSDFNRALAMQGKEPITLNDDQCELFRYRVFVRRNFHKKRSR